MDFVFDTFGRLGRFEPLVAYFERKRLLVSSARSYEGNSMEDITLYMSISESLSSEYLEIEFTFSLVARLPSIGIASSLTSLIPPVPWLSESSDVCKEYTERI